MHAMTPDECLAFLAAGARTGKLATVRRDGRPHVMPVWFAVDEDGALVFVTGAASVKGRTLRRTRRAMLCADDETPPFAFVTAEGPVELSEDLALMLHWATRIAERYMGPGRAEEFGRRNAVAGEVLVRLRPERLLGHGDLTG
jgi:PPOX class probable F420-dependent enzyme